MEAGSTQRVMAEFSLSNDETITPNLTANFGGSYIKARYGDFPGVSCYLVLTNANTGATVNQPNCTTAATATPKLAAGAINASGNHLAGSPDDQFTAALNYDRPKAFGDLTFYAQGNYYWQDKVQYSAAGDPNAIQKAFGMFGGTLGLGAANDKWRLSLYATNLFNQHWAANISAAPTQALNSGGYIQYFSPDSFRHVGIRLDARF
jgi:iron complex outermembrane receptor protein